MTEILIIAVVALALFVFLGKTKNGVGKPSESQSDEPFSKRPLLNKSELKIFKILINAATPDFDVMCQVSYGAILSNKDFGKYMSINSKRADFMLFDAELKVRAVVEYQGSGHFGQTEQGRSRAAKSDQIKRTALQQAGVPLLEIPAKYDIGTINAFVMSLTEQPPGELTKHDDD